MPWSIFIPCAEVVELPIPKSITSSDILTVPVKFVTPLTVTSFVKVELPPVTVSPFCKSANPDDTKVFVANAPLAVMSAPFIFAKATLSELLKLNAVLAPAPVLAPVPPDEIAKGVDNVSDAVESSFVLTS